MKSVFVAVGTFAAIAAFIIGCCVLLCVVGSTSARDTLSLAISAIFIFGLMAVGIVFTVSEEKP